MKIVCLKYGETVFGEEYIFKGGQKDRLLPISFCFYLIEINSKKILVDTGCNECANFVFSIFHTPEEALKNYGLTPKDITDVIITHHHHDHIGCVSLFENAVIHIQEDEYTLGKNYIPKNFKINLFKNELIIENKIKILKIGGHSIGSCIVLIDNFVICGDECYVEKCLTDKIPTGVSVCHEKSMSFVNKYSDNKYTPLLLHDPDILKGKLGFKIF